MKNCRDMNSVVFLILAGIWFDLNTDTKLYLLCSEQKLKSLISSINFSRTAQNVPYACTAHESAKFVACILRLTSFRISPLIFQLLQTFYFYSAGLYLVSSYCTWGNSHIKSLKTLSSNLLFQLPPAFVCLLVHTNSYFKFFVK